MFLTQQLPVNVPDQWGAAGVGRAGAGSLGLSRSCSPEALASEQGLLWALG